MNELSKEYYQELGWDVKTGKPSKKVLLELGLDDVAKELYK
jgi:aldehyde:ferredoxin oxidoreductase